MTNSSQQNKSSTFPRQHVHRVLSGLLLTISILSSAHSAELAHIALEERLGLEFAAQTLNYTVTINQGAAKDTTRLALRDTKGAHRLAARWERRSGGTSQPRHVAWPDLSGWWERFLLQNREASHIMARSWRQISNSG